MLLMIILFLAADSAQLVKEHTHGTDPDGIIWGVGTNCAVLADETLYVADPASFKIYIFNPEFEQIGEIGRKGKGPGEFEELKSIGVTTDGNLGAFDATMKRLTIFSPDGKVLSTTLLESTIVGAYNPVFLEGGTAAFLAPKSKNGKPVYDLSLYNSKMVAINSLFSLEMPVLDWSQMEKPQFWVKFLQDRFEILGRGLPLTAAIDHQTMAFTRSNSTTVWFYSPTGEKKRSFSVEVSPKYFSPGNRNAAFREVWSRLCSDSFLANNMPEAVFKKAASAAELPDVLPRVRAMVPIAGGLALLTNYQDLNRQGEWMLFDFSGNLKATTAYTGPASHFTATGNLLVAVGFNAEEDIVIKRYRWKGPILN